MRRAGNGAGWEQGGGSAGVDILGRLWGGLYGVDNELYWGAEIVIVIIDRRVGSGCRAIGR